MTDTGQVPGEGLPESAGMVEQPGAPAHGAYTYLSENTVEDEDLLLLPGAQGAWGNEVPPPAPEPVLETVHQPGPHEISGRDSGSVDLGGVRLPDPPPIPPITPRRPLHLGPPLPDSSTSPVRSLADRGPADAPVRQPAPSPAGPEYLDGPRAPETPSAPAAPWSAQVTHPAQVSAGAAPAETVVPATEPMGTAQAVATPATMPMEGMSVGEDPAGAGADPAEDRTATAEDGQAAPVGMGVGASEGPAAASVAGHLPAAEPAVAGDPAGASTGPDADRTAAAAEHVVAAQAQDPTGTGALPAEAAPETARAAGAEHAVPQQGVVVEGDAAGVTVGADAVQVAEAGAVAAPGAEMPSAAESAPVAEDASEGAGTSGPEAAGEQASSAGQVAAGEQLEPVGPVAVGEQAQSAGPVAAAEQATSAAAEQAEAPAPAPEAGRVPEAVPFPEAASGPEHAVGNPSEAAGAQATAPVPDGVASDAVAHPPVAAPEAVAQTPAADAAPEAAGPVPDATAPVAAAPVPDATAEAAAPVPTATAAEAAAPTPDATASVAPEVAAPVPEATAVAAPGPDAAPDAAAQVPHAAAPEAQAPVPAPGVTAPEAGAPIRHATASVAPEAAAPGQALPAEEPAPQTPAASDGVSSARQSEVTAPQPPAPGVEAPGQVAAAPASSPESDGGEAAAPSAEAAPPAPAPTPVADTVLPADAPAPAAPETAQETASQAHAPAQPPAATAPDEALAPGEPPAPGDAPAPLPPQAPEAPVTDPAADAAVPADAPEAIAAAPAAGPVAPDPAPGTPAPAEDVTVVLPAPAAPVADESAGQPVQGPQQSLPTPPETLEPPAPTTTVPAPRDGDAELAQNADDLDTRAAEQEDLADQERREESAAAVAEARQSTGPAAPGYDPAEREAVLKVMRERRDIRNGFRSDPIPHEVLLRVLEAAHHAPSVGHSQPWDFVVIRSADTRRAMHELAMRQRDAYAKSLPKGRAKQFKELKIEAILDTPVNIVVTADPTRGGRHTLGRHTQPQMAPYSAALAVENLWLAARAEGLGVGWVSFFDEREMVRALGLPEHLEIIAYLCVGYVDEFPDEPELLQAGWSKRRPLSWVVHEETYGRRALPGEEPHDLLAETVAQIRPLDAKALGEAWERQKRMTKPAGALGMLEIISAQLSGLSRQCPPPIPEPAAVAIFAGDHGVHAQGVTPWPQEVTAQMVANFLGGGAVCNAFATQVGAEVCIVDVGVAADLPATPGLLPRKIRGGTSDMTTGPAMTREEARQAIEVGIETARDLVAAGNKALLTGEMGIANTTASAALIAVFTGADPAEVTGRGTGINDETLARKTEVVRRALELHQPDPADPIGALAAIGGFEHAAIVGLLLGGASLRTPVILDGVSAGAAALVARAIAPEVLAACIAGHRSAEPGHVAALNKLGLRPLVDLDLRLGEGTGALLALPLVQSTARAMHEVATFDSAGVTEK
ncbi:nicotinate-nucleotide--dimethylbenzimidazole phosphoribosyltransferase [Streptomyces sp. NPDC003007]